MKSKRKYLVLQIDNNETELAKFLRLEGEYPFNLPEYFEIPLEKKAISKRAKFLMVAGLSFLKEKYPKNQELKLVEFETKQDKNQEKIKGWI